MWQCNTNWPGKSANRLRIRKYPGMVTGFPFLSLSVLAAGIAYGVALEFYQGWLISGRSASPADVLADAAGVALGIAMAAGFRHRQRRSVTGG